MTEQILVPFDGEDSGVGELTWGQLDIWAAMQRESSSLGIAGVLALPAGTTIQGVAADLAFLMSRHTALRTRLRFGADGRPQQVLARSGEVPLMVIDPGDTDAGEITSALLRRWDQQEFDYVEEWPIRWAVIVQDGAATQLVSVINHLAADGMAVVEMLQDLARRDPATGQADGPVTALQPLELAREQAAPPARRRSAAALRYWERTLRAIPARRFTESRDERQPRYWQAWYDSPASFLAVQTLAVRSRATTSTVLLAAFAIALARLTDTSPVVIQTVVDNRFRRDLAQVVSPLCLSVPCVIDVANLTFDEVVARAWRSAINAYKLAYYDPVARDELVARIGRERGEELDLSCFVNDRRMQSRTEPGDGPLPTPGDVRAALPNSVLTWGYQKNLPSEKCFLHVNNTFGTLGILRFEINADTRYLSPSDMEACLRGLEAVVVEAVLSP
jgi:hypothetical protein